jgi:hypothetical protein
MMSELTLKYRKRSIHTCLQSLPKRLAYITVGKASELLVKMGRGQEKIWWLSVQGGPTAYEWTAFQFKTNNSTKDCLADRIHIIEFYGGPPGQMQLCKGTLLTLLMDRLLMELHRGGFNALDAILPLQENYVTKPRQYA